MKGRKILLIILLTAILSAVNLTPAYAAEDDSTFLDMMLDSVFSGINDGDADEWFSPSRLLKEGRLHELYQNPLPSAPPATVVISYFSLLLIHVLGGVSLQDMYFLRGWCILKAQRHFPALCIMRYSVFGLCLKDFQNMESHAHGFHLLPWWYN